MEKHTKEVAVRIVDPCKSDPEFKQKVLRKLLHRLAEDNARTHWKKLDRAIRAIENLK
jgi:hypothetical protein